MATGCASCSCSPVFATAWNPLNSTHNHAIGGTPCFLRRPAALALPLFSILCFLGSILQVPKVIAKPNASDSDRTALHAASSPDRLGEMDFFPRLLDLLVSNLAVLLSQIREVVQLCFDICAHKSIQRSRRGSKLTGASPRPLVKIVGLSLQREALSVGLGLPIITQDKNNQSARSGCVAQQTFRQLDQ